MVWNIEQISYLVLEAFNLFDVFNINLDTINFFGTHDHSLRRKCAFCKKILWKSNICEYYMCTDNVLYILRLSVILYNLFKTVLIFDVMRAFKNIMLNERYHSNKKTLNCLWNTCLRVLMIFMFVNECLKWTSTWKI